MSGMTNDEKLVYMVNQIARNFGTLGHDDAVAATEDHLLKFWDPRMKARIVMLMAEHAGTLSPVASGALSRLRAGIGPGLADAG
ncbi:formate dehydrogenase subunit delta [Rhizorhabdus wittichii]|jgi:formate dehydrogenase subunit delta|uniref:Formate dehydrogenase delta subunit n=2 Tax=Rhizorhabdus wittichii TaxID=160791 RepID=A0A9J9LE99_RHIWR|nr:formate dehydrogenase subunit delta [Rhizorhabdus wittichii]ABQ67836.1 formate dehydrogenase delta subunit [Rhizorhabdus wittichii RW1]QTH21635.1 formate dehydrogenase subunit delta [Rhizorhabdus wittichii]